MAPPAARVTGRLVGLLLGLLVLLGPLVARASEPATLAVLPLTMGAGSETYDGLGRALAGMIVADLSDVEHLRLVERDRLDALLAEIELAETGFLDPSTAQRLGEGVGSELVLVGTYSVVGAAMVMDARIVDVESADVIKAVKADGTLEDFVTVEKDLVEALLDELDIAISSSLRRRLLTSAPTERFDAFAAYGEGLERRHEGNYEDARAAFERALASDPEFAAASEALSGLRTMLEESKSRAAAAVGSAQAEAHAAILSHWPDERTREPGFRDDADALAGLALRLAVLENEGRHCQRAEELQHFLERVDFAIPFDYQAYDIAGAWAEKVGFEAVPWDLPAPKPARTPPSTRVSVLRDLHAAVLGDNSFYLPHESSGLVSSIIACYEPAERLDRIDAVKAALERSGVEDRPSSPSALTVAEELELRWAAQRARYLGSSDELTRRTEALLVAHEADGARGTVTTAVEHVLRLADEWEQHQVKRQGATPEEMVDFMRALAEADATKLDVESPYCAQIVLFERSRAMAWVPAWEESEADDGKYRDSQLDSAGLQYALMRSMGCIHGVEGRFEDMDEVVAYLQVAVENMPPEKKADADCMRAVGGLQMTMSPAAIETSRSYEGGRTAFVWGALVSYYGGLVFNRCIDDRG